MREDYLYAMAKVCGENGGKIGGENGGKICYLGVSSRYLRCGGSFRGHQGHGVDSSIDLPALLGPHGNGIIIINY